MARIPAFWLALVLGAVLIGPSSASAREESKIQVSLDPIAGAATPGGARGSMRLDMMDDGAGATATMQVKVQHLAPNLEHIVMGDGVEVARFTTNAAGNGGITLDLLTTGGFATPSFDPRGKFLSVNDGSADVIGGWVYADPANDPSRVKVKEVTTLARIAPATTGSTTARYDQVKKGSRLEISLNGVPVGDYDIAVDGTAVGSVTTNAGGFARLRFDTKYSNGNGGGNGKSKGNGHGNSGGPSHNQKKGLDFDPRGAQIDVMQGGLLIFSGPMLAQIDHLGLCAASDQVTQMALDPAQATGAGVVTTGVEESCDLFFEVDVADLATGNYDLVVDAAVVGSIAVADDGSGDLVGAILFDETPDSGENVLGFAFGSGSIVEVKQGATRFLSATLP